MKPLEKIIIASSVPLNTPKTAYDPMLRTYYSCLLYTSDAADD